MRKYWIIMMILISQSAFAININSIFGEFKEEKKAEYVRIPRFLIWVGKCFSDDKEDKEILGKISSIKVLSLEGCNENVKKRFSKRVSHLNDDNYDILMKVKENDQLVTVMTKQKKNTIKELVIVCGGDDCALISIKGNFNEKDISLLVEQETSKRHGRK